MPRSRTARYLVCLALACLCAPAPARAFDFRVGEVDGLLDLTLSYGLLLRTESRDPDLIGIGNGGNAPSVNADDGNLNYGKGVVSNAVRATAELSLLWGPLGAYVRGYGFYDFETELEHRDHRALNQDAEDVVGTGGEVQDYFVSARLSPGGIPVVVRVGNQVVNWGESSFLRLGVDTVNPLDFLAIALPTSSARDLYVRQGMLWAAANLTETLAVEGFYQYQWEPARLPPTGWFLSNNDVVGADGARFAMEGLGQFSDLGTDLDATFGLPEGTLGFDPTFMRIPTSGRREPDDQGQFGFTIQSILPRLNASKLAFHFLSYHSRLPLLMGRTAGAAAVERTSAEAVEARALELADEAGIAFDDALQIEQTLTIGGLANETRSFLTYPEDIRMLGISFNTATVTTGTLVSGELSHHFDWPVQLPAEQVIAASLSPLQFSDAFAQTPLGSYGPDQVVKGFIRRGKTQAALSLIQLFGPRLGATQTLLALDLGWVHIHDLPSTHPNDTDSFGYRITAALTYESVLGGFGVRPFVFFTHDAEGTTPGPAGAFIEDRKILGLGLRIDYTNTWTLDLLYSRSFGGGTADLLHDRDFVALNLSYHY